MKFRNYRDNEGINQSHLKTFLNYTKAKKLKDDDEENISFTIGSIVDTILTNNDEFNNLFYISKLEDKPSDSIMIIMKRYFELGGTSTIDLNLDLLYSVILNKGYCSNYKKETVINKVLKEGADYLEQLIEADNKTIISEYEYNLASDCANILATHNHTKNIFRGNIETQKEIYFDYEGLKCKALLDIWNKKELVYTDLKTTSFPTLHFPKSIIKYRYDFQLVFYEIALREYYRNKDKDLFYKIDNGFLELQIVVDNPYNSLPLVYKLSKEDRIKAKTDIDIAINNYKSYLETGILCPVEILNNNGLITTNLW